MLDQSYQEYKERIRAFAARVVAPYADEWDRQEDIPWSVFEECAKEGLLGVFIPKEYGGSGLNYVNYAIAIIELSRICGSTGISVAAHNSLGAGLVFGFGNEAQRRQYFPALVNGTYLGAFGLTEPMAGSDSAGTRTTARREGEYFIINGTKCFITNAARSGVVVCNAVTDAAAGHKGITSFLVASDAPGYKISKKEHKIGLRGSDTCELTFEEVRVHESAILGEYNNGFSVFMKTLDGGRIAIGALALGLAIGAFDYTMQWLGLNRYEDLVTRGPGVTSLRTRVAAMATELEAAHMLIYQAALMKDAHRPITKEAAMAKLYASEVGTRVCAECMNLLGEEGMTRNHPLERLWRDVKLDEIGEGTSEIQRLVISRELAKEAGLLGKK